jgi:hypothetical protein
MEVREFEKITYVASASGPDRRNEVSKNASNVGNGKVCESSQLSWRLIRGVFHYPFSYLCGGNEDFCN